MNSAAVEEMEIEVTRHAHLRAKEATHHGYTRS
jgi:hypothetical protein